MKRDGSHLVVAIVFALLSQTAMAVPTFQVHIQGGYAGTNGPDQDTWFTSNSPFDLIVVGAYKLHGSKETVALKQVTLVLSVPDGQTGTISITDGDTAATLLFDRAEVPSTAYFNPNADADVDLLTDIAGNDDYFDGYATKSFLPQKENGKDAVGNNHYPFQNDVSDFLLFALGDFDNSGPVHNYNADDGGSITENTGFGEEKTYSVSITGFSRVHFDVYGYDVYSDESAEMIGTWSIAPGSHDSTYAIPAPGAIVLSCIGAGLVARLRIRRIL